MACGTPMLVSDITGFRELVGGGADSVMVPRGDPAAWARATSELLPLRDRRRAMGAAGRAKALRFAWPIVAGKVLEVYRSVGP